MENNSGDTQARFLAKEPGRFYSGRELHEETRIQKSFCRRFAHMNADRIKPATEKPGCELRE
jgi:hypothetical protein